eukprot:jgi/Undpi1/13778/HiC_scaffold_9.g03429.m1
MAEDDGHARFPRAGRDRFKHDSSRVRLPKLVSTVIPKDQEGGEDAVVSLESSTQCDADDDGLLDVYKEGLSSDFRQTPWKKPSKGVGLYFVFVRRMIAFTVAATVLTLPHLLMCMFGDSLTRGEMDPLRLLTFAAGNHRLANVSDVTSTDFHPCEGGGNATVDTLFSGNGATCDDQFLRLIEDPEVLLTAKNGSYVIMVCDVLCCILFMVVYWRVSNEIVEFEQRAEKENVTPADYSVEVRGIPEDANDEEVINHFSELFRLDKPGWTHPGWGWGSFGKKTADMPEDVTDCAGVSIGSTLGPVKSTAHSRFDHICQGTWLAECALAHPEGDFIRQLKSRAKTFELISWKTSSAFVVFNHETSVIRCLADYARYPLWMQPAKLRFRGTHKIVVKRAPEAGNILWENLELSARERGRRKTLTVWVTVLLLGVSFALLYASNIAETTFNWAASASEERCLVTIPAEHGLEPSTPYIGSLEPGDTCGTNDIWVTLEGSPYQSAGQSNSCVEPCVDSGDARSINCGDGVSFSPWQIATCLCRQKIEEEGMNALEFVRLAGGGCWVYGTKYAVGELLTLIASANVVFINFGLKYVLKRMGDFERHPSVTEQAVSNTWKIALALFINSACVVLLVGISESISSVSSDGTNTARSARQTADRTEWYMTTGQALITTIAINVVAPRGPDLVEYFVLGPWRRRSASAASAVTQRQLNKSWKGRNFDLSSRLPITLMMMAVAMTFSPALPVLFPMVALYLVGTYFGDKFHLLRVCHVPPQYDGRIVKVAVQAMPWMLVCHCLFALFAFSGDAFFASDQLSDILSTSVQEQIGSTGESTGSAAQSLRVICVPYIIIPSLIALHALLTSTVGRLFRLWWSALTCKCFRGSAKVSGPRIRVTIPPYTEVFERGYPPREAVPTFFQKEMGWLVREDSRGCHFLHKTKEPSTSRKRSHRKDETREPDLMLTWEVLRSVYPTHTFHMEDNLVYRDIVATRNIIAQELGITTPKSPGGKLWSPAHYASFKNDRAKASVIRRARETESSPRSPR